MFYNENYFAENENSDYELKDKSLEEYLGYDPDNKDDGTEDRYYEARNTYKDPAVMEQFTEHMDLTDSMTRKAVICMNEADQQSVLSSLTSRLYDNIVSKADDIDYGDIPSTKGDITKLPNYDKLRECIELLKDILKEFKQDTTPIDVLSTAMANIMSRKDLFGRAFKFNCDMPVIMYNSVVLGIINGVSYMIATSIEFIKTPNRDSFEAVLNKVAYTKTKNNLIYNNLKKFNKSCESGDFDKVMENVIQHHIHGVSESSRIDVMRESGTFTFIGLGISSLLLILSCIIPILRELVYLFFYTRMRVSDFFDIQADLLQMNAFNVKDNDKIDTDDKDRIVSKQLKIVELFRKISNKISFTSKKAELDTEREITANSKKMKLNDISDELPDSVSSLF